MADEINLRPMSRYQFGTLKFIAEHNVTLKMLKSANAGTLGSIADPRRGYLRLAGAGEDAAVLLTHAGEEALRSYIMAGLNQREHDGELTERCANLLKHARRNVRELKTA